MGKSVSEMCSMLYEMAKTDSARRFHSLYDKICRMDFLSATPIMDTGPPPRLRRRYNAIT